MKMNIDDRVSFYAQKLQEAAIESGYGLISKDTLILLVKKYVATYKPPQSPTENRIKIPEVNFKDYVIQKEPDRISNRQIDNVVNIFSRKK